MDEIIDRFGTPPEEVELLWRLAKVRAVCRKLRIRRINVRAGMIRITFAEHSEVNGDALVKMAEKNSRYMKLEPGRKWRFCSGLLRWKSNRWTGLKRIW